MARKNNPAEMTIAEQLEALKEEVCDKLCKYPEMADHEEITQEDFDMKCEFYCPLRKISSSRAEGE